MLEETVDKKKYKGLCSAIIYGPNASGKTNIIGAMDTFKSIVLRGNIRNDDDKNAPNAAANALELIPNSSLENSVPISFAIKFITDGLLIEYAFSMDLGKFLEVDHPRKILSESLCLNGSAIFSRHDGIEFGALAAIAKFQVNDFEQNAEECYGASKKQLKR